MHNAYYVGAHVCMHVERVTSVFFSFFFHVDWASGGGDGDGLRNLLESVVTGCC